MNADLHRNAWSETNPRRTPSACKWIQKTLAETGLYAMWLAGILGLILPKDHEVYVYASPSNKK